MPTDDNKIVTTTFNVGQSLTFTQCDSFVSNMGQLAASLDERLLNCTFTFHALWSPERCNPSDQWVR